MLSFLIDAIAAAVGFAFARLGAAWFDARVSQNSFIEEERTQDVQRVVASIDRLTDLGGRYWATDASDSDQELEAQIVPLMHDVSAMCRELFEGDAWTAIELEINRFDDAVTGGAYGSKLRKRDLQAVVRIRKQAADLARVVRRQRRRLPRKWW
jgi:hypothetical protein